MKTYEHPLSWEALSRVIILGLIILFVWKALGAVAIIATALVLTTSLFPIVYTLHTKTKLPMLLSTIVVFFVLFIPFVIIAITIVPDLSNQLPKLLTNIDSTLSQISFYGYSFNNFNIVQYIGSHSNDIIASSSNIILNFFSIITTLILTFYFVYDYDRLLNIFLNIFPYKEKLKLKGFIEEIAKVTGQYIRGNVIISFITFFVIYIGLLIFRIPFALPLAIFAGILDLLPLVGSTLGAIPALIISFSLSPLQGFLVLLLHLVYQQIENAVISPAIYNKALNLYPSLGFLAVVIGASSLGILGAFLALPIAASIPVAINYYHANKSKS